MLAIGLTALTRHAHDSSELPIHKTTSRRVRIAAKSLAPCARRPDTKAIVLPMQLYSRRFSLQKHMDGEDALTAEALSISLKVAITSRVYLSPLQHCASFADQRRCTCRHEFCYACGANWKTCECPNWDEQYIAAENDDDNPEAAAEGPDQHGVGRCEHELWTFVRGRGVCADCHWRSNLFTMVCNQCGLRACRRCMQNRLRDRVEVAEHRIEVAAQGVEVVEMPRREEPGEVMLRLLGQTRDFLADVFRW